MITVRSGDAFSAPAQTEYEIDPARREDYVRLFGRLQETGWTPDAIVDCRSVEQQGDGLDGMLRLVYLAQALDQFRIKTRLVVLTAGGQEVTGDEDLVPACAPQQGAAKVIPQEFPGITCQAIDVPELFTSHTIRLLLAELADDGSEPVVAYRGRHRWVQTYEAVTPTRGQPPARLRDRGVYLITGGLGRIGIVFARWLAKRCQARLVLVDRFGLTPGSPQAAAVAEIESLGAEVTLVTADVADEAAMREAIDIALSRFGALHGVLHLAGITEQGAIKPLSDLKRADCERQFRPKVSGSEVLAGALKDKRVDFCLLQSSLSSVLGGPGLAAYSGANLFMDLFARQQNKRGASTWLSINWDGWRFGDEPAAMDAALELALTPEEGVQALELALSLTHAPQVVISTADLDARLKRWLTSQPAATSDLDSSTGAQHERPGIAVHYVAPRSDLERAIATEWQQMLGIRQVGVNDDFFELGGHSLLGTQLISHLRDRFAVELPLRRLFETPTVAGLAAMVEESRAGGEAAERFAVKRVPRDTDLPLSFAQQRLWFLDQLEPGSPLYNNSAAVELTGKLDAGVLTQSLAEIIRRHEVLRTVFRARDGKPVQVVLPEMAFDLPVIDLSGRPVAEQMREVARLAAEQGAQPFRLDEGPLMRFALVRLGEARHAGLLTMHHIVSDGWSVGVLMRELCGDLCGLRTGSGFAARAAGHPVRRFRRMAARLVAGRRTRKAIGLLERATGRAASAPGPALGPAAPSVAGFPGQPAHSHVGPGRVACFGDNLQAGRGHAFHGAVGSLPGADLPIHKRRRYSDRHAHRRTQPCRNRGPHRLLREHAGDAHEPDGNPTFRELLGRVKRNLPRRLRLPGSAVRKGGGRDPAGAGPEPHAAVPVDVRAPERSHRVG